MNNLNDNEQLKTTVDQCLSTDLPDFRAGCFGLSYDPTLFISGGELINCPFCGERDYDAIGLKGHLSHGDCEAYNVIEPPPRLF